MTPPNDGPTTDSAAPDAAPAPAATAPTKRAKVSERVVLDAKREEADTYINATGFSYRSLSEPGTSLEVLFRPVDPDKALDSDKVLPMESIYALAAFGGLTLAGNVTNSIRNGEPKADGPQTEREALEAWISDLFDGNWTKATGEVEPGLGLLAAAVARTLTENDGKDRTSDEAIAKIKAWLSDVDKETRKKWRADKRVQRHSAAITAERKAAAAATSPATPLPEVPTDI